MVTSGFFRGESFDPDKDIPDLDGQVYIVTGASTGIGYGIVAHLLQHNASKIVILNNAEEHAQEALADLKQYGDISRLVWQQCNLRNLQQTDQVAKRLRTGQHRIDGLILNAGIGVNKVALTEPDNLDSHFKVNMLTQLHLALILLPTLKATAETTGRPSRVVFMSSEMHRFSPSSTEFASVEEINTNVGATELYARSKLAQILITRELAQRLDRGELGFSQSPGRRLVIVNATHPGGVKTPQEHKNNLSFHLFFPLFPLRRSWSQILLCLSLVVWSDFRSNIRCLGSALRPCPWLSAVNHLQQGEPGKRG